MYSWSRQGSHPGQRYASASAEVSVKARLLLDEFKRTHYVTSHPIFTLIRLCMAVMGS